jgi:signal transduction histidine kinase/ligand-binding sensor domain-containing protein
MGTPRTAFLYCPLFFLLLIAVNGLALDPSKRISQYQHKMWRVQDGLLPKGPGRVWQTTDGYLWAGVGSPFPALRFDGVRFVPWSFPVPSSSRVNDFLAAKSGGFWVGDLGGVTHVNGNRVIAHFDLKGSVASMVEDTDGSLWVVLARYGGGPLCQITSLGAHCFSEAGQTLFEHVGALLPDGKGGIWVGTNSAVVHWKSGHSETYGYDALKTNPGLGVTGLAPNSDGSLWVGIEQGGPGLGLEKFIGGESRPFVIPNFDGTKIDVSTLLVDREQNLWVGTYSHGLYRIHGETVDHFGSADGLSSDTVYRLCEDREGILWIATSSGLDSLRDRNVTTFSHVEGLSVDLVVSIMASRDGTVWLANDKSLDYIRNGQVFSVGSSEGLPTGHQVTALLEDRKGRIWVGVDDSLFILENHRFRRLPEPNHHPLGLVASLAEDIDGNIWAVCASKPGKLVRIRDFQVQEEFSSSQVPSAHTIAADPKGGIWLSRATGDLLRFQNGAIQTFPLKVVGDFVRQIEVESDGSVLAAAPLEGLIALRAGNFQRLTKKNGLPCNGVSGFVRDDKKNWWLQTLCGYIFVADSEMQRWWDHPDTVVQYQLFDFIDGAQPALLPFSSVAKSPDGRLWFAAHVVQTIDPRQLLFNRVPPPVHIEQLIADRKAYEVDSETNVNVALPPRVRDLEIDYTALSMAAPEKVRFRYKLEGRDTGWQEPETRRQAFYTDLRPGKYRFRVIACNNNGVWNEEGASLDFNIAPTWYQTNWFRAACAATFLLLLWFIYQLRLRQLHHQFSIGLEARVNERTRIARDLHDTLLQSFHGLLLRFQTVHALLPSRPEEAKQSLGSIIDQAAQAITESRDAVQGLRSSTIDSNDLAVSISSVGEELSTDKTDHNSAVFHVQVEGTPRKLNPIMRDEIYRIACEALRNAFQHAEARQIEVEIRYDDGHIRLRVRDDGKGIDPKVLSGDGREGHYGLQGMRERAELVGGKLTVWSDLDSGTEVELSIPAAAAYATSARRSWFEKFSGRERPTKREL